MNPIQTLEMIYTEKGTLMLKYGRMVNVKVK